MLLGIVVGGKLADGGGGGKLDPGNLALTKIVPRYLKF